MSAATRRFYDKHCAGDGRGSVCIVVDVVRASTTILTLVERGVGSIRFTTEIDEAKRQATASNPPALLIGEQGGIIAPGFDLDNSPLAVRAASIAGRVAVMRTSNGTVVLSRLGHAPAIFVGCCAQWCGGNRGGGRGSRCSQSGHPDLLRWAGAWHGVRAR